VLHWPAPGSWGLSWPSHSCIPQTSCGEKNGVTWIQMLIAPGPLPTFPVALCRWCHYPNSRVTTHTYLYLIKFFNFWHIFQSLWCSLSFILTELTYLVCGLLTYNCKLLMANDEVRKRHNLVQSAWTESSLQQSGLLMHKLWMYYVCNNQITVLFLCVDQ
jgi:hypothetical protein